MAGYNNITDRDAVANRIYDDPLPYSIFNLLLGDDSRAWQLLGLLLGITKASPSTINYGLADKTINIDTNFEGLGNLLGGLGLIVNNLTIDPTYTLTATEGLLVVRARDTITVNGSIVARQRADGSVQAPDVHFFADAEKGNLGVTGNGSALGGGGGGGGGAGCSLKDNGSAGGNGGNGSGGTGGAGGAAMVTQGGAGICRLPGISPESLGRGAPNGATGGNGGVGLSADGGAGGAGGKSGGTIILSAKTITIGAAGIIDADGVAGVAGGTGQAGSAGGGGGGGGAGGTGGHIVLIAKDIIVTAGGIVKAIGKNGGAGGNGGGAEGGGGGGGAGGDGGAVWLLFGEIAFAAGATVTAGTGGAGGTGANNGVAGTNGITGFTILRRIRYGTSAGHIPYGFF